MQDSDKKEEQDSKKGGFSLFGGKNQETGPGMPEAFEQINNVSRRLRILESRYTDMTRRMQVMESSMLNERKRLNQELKTMESDILEVKRDVNEIKSTVERIVSELKNFAGKEDVVSLKKYIEIWEPVNFVTRNEVEKIVSEMMGLKEEQEEKEQR